MAEELRYTVEHRPDFAMLTVHLEEGQRMQAEASAMTTMDPSIHMKAGFKGGLLKAVGRGLGGESMIQNTFTARDGPGSVGLAPGPMGDLVHHRLDGGGKLLLQRGAYLASSEGVEVSGSWQGMRGFFSGEGLVLLRASGEGDLFFNTYGAILEVDVRDQYYVDTGYVVAFEDTLQYTITTLPGLSIGGRAKAFLFGGEGLVCRFSGSGKLWIQTRAVNSFLTWVWPYRPQKRSN